MRKRMIVVTLTALAGACTDPGQDGLDAVEQHATGGPPGTVQIVEIPRNSFWGYSDRGPIACTNWHSPDSCDGSNAACCFRGEFDGTGKQGPLGYGESYIRGEVSYGPDPNNRYRTTYFRKSFVPSNRVRAMYLNVMYDDGFVFYINGREGGRASMPAGAISYSTFASGHEANNAYRTFDITSQIPNLVSGANSLSFEVHQASASSSDLVFDAELVLWEEPYEGEEPEMITTREGIPRRDRWRFWDQAAYPGDAWRTPGYDDDGWSVGSGPLGFGESYLQTQINRAPITTYFRKPFVVRGIIKELDADVMYDDGFVAYLNGTEIQRAAMPAGTITQSTQSTGHEANNTYYRFDWDHARSLLVDGVNELAVEVHQYGTASSDLVFDLGLELRTAWTTGQAGVERLNDVWFVDGDLGYAVGGQGTVLRITNAGASWTQVVTPVQGEALGLNGVQFVDAQHGWIVGSDSTVMKTADGGASWTLVPFAEPNLALNDVSFVSLTHGWIQGQTITPESERRTRLWRTTDGGATWTEQFIPQAAGFGDIDFVNETHGWTVGRTAGDDRVSVFGTGDGGVTWTVQWQDPDPFSRAAVAVEAIDATTVWFVGGSTPHDDSGEIKYVTRDGGLTWTEAPRTPDNMMLLDITFLDATHGWAVGKGGGIIATRDGGLTWRVQRAAVREPADRVVGAAPEYHAIHFGDVNVGWAVAGQGVYSRTSTGGW